MAVEEAAYFATNIHIFSTPSHPQKTTYLHAY